MDVSDVENWGQSEHLFRGVCQPVLGGGFRWEGMELLSWSDTLITSHSSAAVSFPESDVKPSALQTARQTSVTPAILENSATSESWSLCCEQRAQHFPQIFSRFPFVRVGNNYLIYSTFITLQKFINIVPRVGNSSGITTVRTFLTQIIMGPEVTHP